MSLLLLLGKGRDPDVLQGPLHPLQPRNGRRPRVGRGLAAARPAARGRRGGRRLGRGVTPRHVSQVGPDGAVVVLLVGGDVDELPPRLLLFPLRTDLGLLLILLLFGRRTRGDLKRGCGWVWVGDLRRRRRGMSGGRRDRRRSGGRR